MSVNVKNYKSFEQLASDITQLNQKWKESTANSDKVQTFAGIQRRIQSMHYFISNERKHLYDDIDKLKDVWSGKVVAERKAELTEQFNQMVQTVVENMKQEIETLTSSKLEKIGDMMVAAPTEDHLRLLQVLQMRGDVDPVEVHHILPIFFGNYQSMRALEVISEQNGIALNLPVQLDCRTMYDTLDEATDYLLKACEELPKKIENMSIMFHAFFTVNPEKKDKQYDPKYQQYIDLFDTTPQLQECKTEKKYLSRGEKTRIDWYLRDIKALDPSNPGDYTTMLERVNEVMKDHPDMKNLLKLSDYKDLVEDVEKIKAEELTE